MTARISVTGGAGFLGRYVVDAFRARGHEVLVPLHREYDLTREADDVRMYDDGRPDIVVHLAAVSLIRCNRADSRGAASTCRAPRGCSRFGRPPISATASRARSGGIAKRAYPYNQSDIRLMSLAHR